MTRQLSADSGCTSYPKMNNKVKLSCGVGHLGSPLFKQIITRIVQVATFYFIYIAQLTVLTSDNNKLK